MLMFLLRRHCDQEWQCDLGLTQMKDVVYRRRKQKDHGKPWAFEGNQSMKSRKCVLLGGRWNLCLLYTYYIFSCLLNVLCA
jgi:hypothetical protein